MEGMLTTEISFIEANSGTGIPATGDLLILFSLLLISCTIVFAAIGISRVKKHKSTVNNVLITTISNHKIATLISVLIMIVAGLILSLGFTINAHANVGKAVEEKSDNYLSVANNVKAYVNQNTGEINIENGFIKNIDPDFPLTITKTTTYSEFQFNNSTLNIKSENTEELYGKKINEEKDNNLEINSNSEKTISFKLNNYDKNILDKLINQASIKVNFYYSLNIPKIDISGQVNINQTDAEKRLRNIDVHNYSVYFNTSDGKVFSSTIDEDGNYNISDVPARSTGFINTDIIGCRLLNDEDNVMKNHRIFINEPITSNLENKKLNYEGPEFDNYTLPELKIASTDLSMNSQNSTFFNEFNYYLNNDNIWWSNSDSQQDGSCTSETASDIDINLCNDEYKCHFSTLDNNPQTTAAEINQYLFLRIIGINHDILSDDSSHFAGITLQAISCLPNIYQYGYFNASSDESGWNPTTDFGEFWGDNNCLLRANMNSDTGEIFGGLASEFKNNIVSVNKQSQRTHKWPNNNLDLVTSQDKLFVLSYSEMCSENTEYWGFNEFPWYLNNSEGKLYQWYKNEGISGSTGNAKIKNITKLNNGYEIQFGFNPWLRTVYHKTDQNFLYINSDDGSIYNDNSYENYYSTVITFCL